MHLRPLLVSLSFGVVTATAVVAAPVLASPAPVTGAARAAGGVGASSGAVVRQRAISDPAHDEHLGVAAHRRPAATGAGELRRSTFALSGDRRRVLFTYRLGGLIPAGGQTFAQVTVDPVLAQEPGKTPARAEEFDMVTNLGHRGATTEVFQDRTASCFRTTTTIRRHTRSVVVAVPVTCLPVHARFIDMSVADQVYERRGLATVAKDHTRTAHWSLRARP